VQILETGEGASGLREAELEGARFVAGESVWRADR
jgi:hypothetical protein